MAWHHVLLRVDTIDNALFVVVVLVEIFYSAALPPSPSPPIPPGGWGEGTPRSMWKTVGDGAVCLWK